jgi:predicted amidophosphoribosyltransferase
MTAISPIELQGLWKKGFALDLHTLSSIYMGEDQYGRTMYDTKRSNIGELVYRLKYRNEDTISDINALIIPFLISWGIHKEIELIIPVPPSKSRNSQPVFKICDSIGESLNIYVCHDVLKKMKSQELKGLSLIEKQKAIENSMIYHRKITRPISMLLVDDLYESGATLTAATKILQNEPNVKNIYVLTMTKTRI